MNPILLVDDDPQSLESTRKILEMEGYAVEVAHDGEEALARLQAKHLPAPGLLLSDIRMPKLDGMGLFRALRALGSPVPVVLMTAFGRVEDAVFAMKHGARDFLSKPFKRKELLATVQAALARANAAPATDGEAEGEEVFSWGAHPAMERLRRQLEQVAPTDASVLLHGESGTGKERLARALHLASGRAQGKWVAVNCAAIPEALLESELFGHEKGAFTGASSAKEGLFERADGGTLFLDEIGDLPLSLQPKLLRVLQDGEVRRVGAVQSRRVRVRLVAATHRDLRALVEAGRFRQDLLFRLEVVSLAVPPLREHPEDIEALARRFVREFAVRHGKREPSLSKAALVALRAHAWPGNVRELRNAIERAVVFSDDAVLPEHFPPEIATAALPERKDGAIEIPIGTPLEEVKDLLIQKTLEATAGDKALAARLLGIHERTIYRSLKDK